MFFGGQSHLVHDTKWEAGWGVVGPLRFSKFPFSDHGVHTKIVQPPHRIMKHKNINLTGKQQKWCKFLNSNYFLSVDFLDYILYQTKAIKN